MSPTKIVPCISQACFKYKADDPRGRHWTGSPKAIHKPFFPCLPVPMIFTFQESLAARADSLEPVLAQEMWREGPGSLGGVSGKAVWKKDTLWLGCLHLLFSSPLFTQQPEGSLQIVKQTMPPSCWNLSKALTAVRMKCKLLTMAQLPVPLQYHWAARPAAPQTCQALSQLPASPPAESSAQCSPAPHPACCLATSVFNSYTALETPLAPTLCFTTQFVSCYPLSQSTVFLYFFTC